VTEAVSCSCWCVVPRWDAQLHPRDAALGRVHRRGSQGPGGRGGECALTAALLTMMTPMLTPSRRVQVIHDPYANETFTAVRGQGAFLNGARISVGEQGTLLESLIATGEPGRGDGDASLLQLIGRLRPTA
jgi:hypothetical protein